MCGIFVYIGCSVSAPQIAFEGIKLLEYRGYDSWGVGYIPLKSRNKIIFEKHTGKIGSATLKKTLPSSIAFAHTRWATHGGVTNANAHPHFDCTEEISVIHNGIVENYRELKEMLIKKGHKFKSETDTEVIAHLVEENIKNKSFAAAVFETFNSLAGSNAICVMNLKDESVAAARNGSPLVVGIGDDGEYFLGSDVPAFLKYTNKVHFLEDYEGVVIKKDGVKIFDVKTGNPKPLTTKVLDWKLEDAEKSGFPHFLLKEIHEQKVTIPKAAKINTEIIEKIGKLIKSGYKVVLTGCGTASYCATLGKYFFANAGISAETYGAYEFLPFANQINKKTIVIAVSQSGETADTLIALKEAKRRGAKIAAVVNAKGSAMERMSDFVIPVGAGPEIAVVSTKAFTAQLISLYLIASAANGKLTEAQKNVESLGTLLAGFINKDLEKQTVKLAKKLFEQEHAYVIGKYANYPAALEFALKLKESAYIHAEAFTAGELKHGVITLIQKDTPCFALISNDDVRDEVLSSAAELKARGGKIIGIAPFESTEFDELIKTPDAGSLTVVANIIVGQLLGYYLGIGRGNDPDKPRNLAKSVTVK